MKKIRKLRPLLPCFGNHSLKVNSFSIFDNISIDFNKNKEEYKTKYRTEINEQIPSADEFYGKYTTSEIVSEEEKKEE